MARRLKQRAHTMRIFIIMLAAAASFITVDSADPVNEAELLIKFKSSLSHTDKLSNWDPSKTPCVPASNATNWVGIICLNGKVHGLQLENMDLSGTIDVDSLTMLRELRTISFMNNAFEASLPEFKKLGALKSIYVSNNKFGGEIPSDAFEGMMSLKKVHLAQNKFVGKIPTSLAALPKLLELKLQGNQFDGGIPNFVSKDLKSLDLSNNALSGTVPTSLQNFGTAPFAGNKELCGGPLQQCQDKKTAEKKDAENKTSTITTAVIVGVALIIIVVCLAMPKKRSEAASTSAAQKGKEDELEQMERGSTHSSTSSKRGDQNKLSFLKDDGERFDMPDLLKASAEILGSGYFGSSYKTNLVSGKSLVVKRFRQMNNLPREEFHEHMRRLGRLNHQNLHPISAYYYRKEEKLLVAEFVSNGSLASNIHSKFIVFHTSWNLYAELPSLIAPHGHLKSSNVLLNDSYEPLLNDYGLVPIINQEHAQKHMIPYKSPEYTQHGRITKKTDVWCFGIIILETLTGRFPANFLQQGKSTDDQPDLPTWVNSMIDEDRMEEVFDKDMGWSENNKGEMEKLLRIGLACSESDVEKRWDLKEAVERIEEVSESD